MQGYYPEELIEEIRISNDIVDVVSEYVRLKKAGANFFGLCPFHKEKTPSFSVSPTKQIFSCFGCGKSGNVIHFVMNIENLDFVEAVKFLAERARISLPEGDGKEEQEQHKIKHELLKLNKEAALFYFNQLNSQQNEKARSYLEKRGISQSIIRRFGIGYSNNEWDCLYKHLLQKGFEEEIIIKSGMILQNKNGGFYDRFRGRVMFPIFDIRGSVIAFGGRVLDDSLPKYMNSPETPVYHKGRNLYALNIAKNSGEKRLIVVEGYMDVISLHQCGIINAVASLGTALTENQGRILKKYSEEIIISYDADVAGQSATMRGLDLLNDIGCNVKVLLIPEGKDPDEFIRKNGADEFRKLIDKALTLVEYKIRILRNQISGETIEEKIKFLNKSADVLSRIDNNVEREMYIKKLAKEYDITEESLYAEVYKRVKPKKSFRTSTADIIRKGTEAAGKRKSRESDSKNGIEYYEKILLALMCVDNSIYRIVSDKIKKEDYTGELNKKIAAIIYDRLSKKKEIVSGELFTLLGQDMAGEMGRIIQQEINYEETGKAALDILKKIEICKLDKRQQEILEILSKKGCGTEGNVEKLKLELKAVILKKKSV